MSATVLHGDCIALMAEMPAESVDAIVTDPPYGLGFMGKAWDDLPPGVDWARECLRVLKPGGYLLAFGGTRTWHRLAVAVEDAGFEIRDSIAWLYGSGFPKSLDVSKAIDKARDDRHAEALTVTREMARSMREKGLTRRDLNLATGRGDNGAGSAQSWTTVVADGAHKPRVPTVDQWAVLRDLLDLAHLDAEVWRLNGRKGKPGDNWEAREVTGLHLAGLGTGTSGVGGRGEGKERRDAPATSEAERWQGWGTALKPGFEPVVVGRKPLVGTVAANVLAHGTGALNIDATRIDGKPRTTHADGHRSTGSGQGWGMGAYEATVPAGRWPANVALDEHAAAELDAQSGTIKDRNGGRGGWRHDGYVGGNTESDRATPTYRGEGGASRFFYIAKAPKRERPTVDGIAHPTVKPLALMRWLVRLVTPPGGTVLDTFAGSGTTVEAALLEGFRVTGIEREADYLPLIHARIERQAGQLDLGEGVA